MMKKSKYYLLFVISLCAIGAFIAVNYHGKGSSVMGKNKLVHLYLINDHRIADRHKFPSEEARAARYSGILPEITEALAYLFSDGEFSARERVVEHMQKELGFSYLHFNYIYLFKSQKHKTFFEEKIINGELLPVEQRDFAENIDTYITAFSFLSDNPNEARIFSKTR